MLPRKRSRYLAVWLAAMLAWGQVAVAGHACAQPMRYAAMPAVAEMQAPDCHHDAEELPSALCKSHCDRAGQSHQVPAQDMPALALVSLWLVATADKATPYAGAVHLSLVPPAGAPPPIRIQYQVFLD